MNEFFGESRIRLVDGLVNLYDSVATSRRSSWVSLEAPSGWGKTRVGHEFYSRLVERQEPPRYWPAVIDDPRLGRKATNPIRFERAARSLPQFLWWGIGCSTRYDVPEDALRRDLAQLEAHSLYVEAAWRALVSVRERATASLTEMRRRLSEDDALELISIGAEQVFGVVLPPLGMASRLVHWTAKQAKDAFDERRMIQSITEVLVEEPLDIVDDTVDLLSRLGQSGLPVVILVEDLHKADNALLDLLNKLMRREGAVMVISTTLPDVMETDTALNEVLSRHTCSVYRVTEPGIGPSRWPFPEGAGLFELEKSARSSILHSFYPYVEETTKAAILDTYVNPLALELFCQIPKYRRSGEYRTAHGKLWLPVQEREHLPQRIDGLYRRIWDELPSEIRFALAIAYIIIPANISSGEARDEDRWTDSVLRDVIARIDHPDTEEVLAALDESPSAYAWIRSIDDDLCAFAELPQGKIAEQYGYALLEEEIADVRAQILNVLACSLVASSRQVVLTINAARSILALHAEDYVSDETAVAQAIHAILVGLESNPREHPECIRLFDRFCTLDMAEADDDLAFRIRRRGALALRESGQLERAIELFELLVADLHRVSGPGHPGIGATLSDLAGALGDAGRLDEAIALFEELVANRRLVQGPDHLETLTARNNLAGFLGRAGRIGDAIASFEALAADQRRVQGPDHPDTLTARNNLAGYLAEDGRLEEAISLLEEVLANRRRILGLEHPATLTTLHNLASKVSQTGRLDDAITLFRGLVVDRERVLGPDHPATLATRINLAGCLGEAGHLEEAILSLEMSVADVLRVLGPDHPATLTARNNLAGYVGRAGRLEEAVGLLKELVADQQRVLGADHPGTLTARNNLAGYLAEAGQLETAISLLEELVADRLRVLGADHPDTLTTRNNLAGYLAEAGQLETAISLLEELVADRLRVLGADHPDTLTTWHNLADCLGRAGQLDEAIDLFERLLTDLLRILGPDHPDTLATRNRLGECVSEAGRVEEAIASLQDLLADSLRVLGPDHPATLTTRHSLAGSIGKTGCMGQAISLLEELVVDRRRVLGPDHPDTLATRSNLAGCTGEAGRPEDAVAQFEELLNDLLRVLGPGHPGTLATRDSLAGYLAEAGRVDEAVALLEGPAD